MKVVKVLGWLLLALILFVGISIYFTASNLNSLVKQAVEQAGSETLKTEVRLAEVDIQLSEAKARLSGLTIKNPPGFTQANVFELGDIQLDLNLEAILEKRIDLTEITIQGMNVVAEQKGTTTNIQTLLNNLPATDKPAGQPESEPEQGGSPVDDMLVKVSKFQFINNDVTLVTEKWGEQSVTVPTINLSNLGGANGVPPDQFAAVVFKRLLKDINQAVKGKLEDVVKDKAKEKLREKEDELKDKYRSKLDEEFGEDADKVDESLKSLLSR